MIPKCPPPGSSSCSKLYIQGCKFCQEVYFFLSLVLRKESFLWDLDPVVLVEDKIHYVIGDHDFGTSATCCVGGVILLCFSKHGKQYVSAIKD